MAVLATAGCGGASLAPDCEGFVGQYGVPGSASELLVNRVVKVYSITGCDSPAVNATCQEVLVKTVRTGTDGTFKIQGLINGDYLVRTFSVEGTTLLNTDRVNLPAVCRATPTPSSTPN